MGLSAYFRLLRAGYVLAREGALSLIDNAALPAHTEMRNAHVTAKPTVAPSSRSI